LAWFALADRQHKTVAELKRQLSHVEFVEWLAYLRIIEKD
jgi:hypothetical protein